MIVGVILNLAWTHSKRQIKGKYFSYKSLSFAKNPAKMGVQNGTLMFFVSCVY